jgi:hypothetical protein
MVTGVRFGVDEARLVIRLDFSRRALDLLSDKGEVELTFLSPAELRVIVRGEAARASARLERRQSTGQWTATTAGLDAAAGQVLELAVAWEALGLADGAKASFFVAVKQDGVELERHPAHQPLVVGVPSTDFLARHWSV